MKALKLLTPIVLALFLSLPAVLSKAAAADYKADAETEALVKALPSAKITLEAGIEQVAKKPEAALSAKFELEDGKLMFSVYTAEKGLDADAEHNVLKEFGGVASEAKWAPKAEVFKDVEHVARSAAQLTLMQGSKVSLADVIHSASKLEQGTVFSVIPVSEGRHQIFRVLVAKDGKVTELRFNAHNGQAVKKA